MWAYMSHIFIIVGSLYTCAVRAPSLFAQAPTDKNTSKDKFMYLKAITNRTLWDLVLCPAWGIYRVYRGLHIPNHLFVQDADKEEPLARSHSHPSLARTDRVALLQSIEALEAFMSWTEKTKSVQQQSNTSPSCPAGCVTSFNKESQLTLITIFTELSDEHNWVLNTNVLGSCFAGFSLPGRFWGLWGLTDESESFTVMLLLKSQRSMDHKNSVGWIIRSEETWLFFKTDVNLFASGGRDISAERKQRMMK